MSEQPLDDCQTRTAIRNLRMFCDAEFDSKKLAAFKAFPPEIPADVVKWFEKADAEGHFKEVEIRLTED